MERVFVYGLLRKGQSMAHMLAQAKYLGETEVDGFDLFHLGTYPGAVAGDGRVKGELYEVESLDALDAAEGVDRSPPLYQRREVETGGERAWIYVYARPLAGTLKIESGDWVKRY